MPDLTAEPDQRIPSTHIPTALQGVPPPGQSFVIGRNIEGQWLAIETHGLGGGIFRSCGDALSYAAFETAHRPQAVRLSDEVLALDL